MVSYQKFAKDVGFIGIVQILTSLGTFFLLPIITKTLGTYYYGLWAQINITVSLISPLALMGLSMGFVRFLSSETDTKKIREAVYSILFFVTVSGLLASLLLYTFAKPLATFGFNDPNAAYFIQAGSFLILVGVIESISLFYFRVFRQIQKFSYFTLFETFGKLLFILILLKLGYGLLGVIAATLLVQGSIFLISFLIIISQIGFVIPRFTYIKEYLQFSLPLTPTALIRWITESSDRYLVTYFLGLRSVGVYSAACSIGNLIQLFVSPLQLILFPELSKLFDENKMDEIRIYMSHSLRYFLLISIPAVFGLAALAKPLLGILTTEDFLSGWFVIPIIAFSGLMAGVFQIFVNTMYLIKRTKIATYINIVAAISNVLINILLIPSIGIAGASLSTLFSYFLMAVLCMHLSLKHFKFDFYFNDIAKSILSSVAMYLFVSHFTISSILELFEITCMGVLIYLVAMLLVGGFSDYELSLIRRYLFRVEKEVKH
ncbi:Membrane protein involved in the export of O-antigen and teichoic acid [Methanosarcina thermophila]|jgi:O-antigen/teichoic acid export membrane protein|uniref:Membrane protein involved in the export of O-antigen and teichoic acid n=2 Tax=Methanosarcina thermophila TaxID=2210 RepID=A0A1I6X279_METTE|nr:flippase [Methanosarcina thermophila]ALK04750.1 MAG: polysaccharide biosynthesis protein [Methanosarcina sp. 795]AKB15909.1 Membrane protein involved in the export of O-antigen, teichoic acid lipoteichoic acids [Methanosarcina thermophila CHTI-55]NLU56532.1 flippase [Methanosarcina thermophila]SFT32350.1 Membrane protein involved in the export of O-antigen and teichoic acid [Methanosarcina thermophila]BAW28461.1 transporter [Methanosarcina thermophila]